MRWDAWLRVRGVAITFRYSGFLIVLAAVLVSQLAVGLSNATIGTVSPVDLRVWLRGVAFIGVGHISRVEMNTRTGSVNITIQGIQGWKGKPPSSVEFPAMPRAWNLSEGQRVVFLAYKAYKPKATQSPYLGYCCPMPVRRIGGRDCFEWQDGPLLIPDELIAVRWEQGPKPTGAPTIVLVNEFRDAVQQTDLLDAP
jgi:hypothetical protein